jgi:signal transduction histidine kinase
MVRGTQMPQTRTTPPGFVIFAVAGGVLFILGAVLTAATVTAQISLIGLASAYTLLGAYTLVITKRRNAFIEVNNNLENTVAAMRKTDTGLRTRMAYTLRDPLTSIFGLADRMVNDGDIPSNERREMLIEIRSNAREVERVLADLATEESGLPGGQRTAGVVLLDEELRSVASTVPPDTTFETDLQPTRAWADSAQVRQILRTIVSAARESGCTSMTLEAEERGETAVATISARNDLLPIEAVAALTGNSITSDVDSDAYIALKEAHDAAAKMRGTIGYAQAFGVSHIVVEFDVAPEDIGIQQPKRDSGNDSNTSQTSNGSGRRLLTYTSAVDLRPERPTTAIRFV